MLVCFIIALLATLIYINLVISDSINARTGGLYLTAANDKENYAVLISKIKYVLLLIMAVTWSIIIHHYI